MKLTKKLFIAIMTMALLVVTFSASTFAWFTLGQEAKLETINVNVESGKGIEISFDGKTWKNRLDLATLSDQVEFKDLTSSDGIAIKQLKTAENNADLANAIYTPDNTSTTDADEERLADYLELVFYVRVTTDIQKVILNSVSGQDTVFSGTNGSATVNDDEMWLSDASLENNDTPISYTNGWGTAKTLEENKYYRFDALNAVKISFQANAKTTAQFIYGYENAESWGTASNNGLAKDYADVKDYDVTSANQPYSGTYVTYAKGDNQPSSGDMVVYDKVDTTGAAAQKATVLATADLSSASNFTIPVEQGQDPIELDENYLYAKVTLRIWLEGWDADCINAILEKTTKLSIVLAAE